MPEVIDTSALRSSRVETNLLQFAIHYQSKKQKSIQTTYLYLHSLESTDGQGKIYFNKTQIPNTNYHITLQWSMHLSAH